MPDLTPTQALAAAPMGYFGTEAATPLTLTALPEACVLHVLLAPGADLPDMDLAARPVAPGQYFLVGDTPLTPKDIAGLQDRLGEAGDIIDQSHGRMRLRLEGPDATRMLAKGVALDLQEDAFAVGRSATTLCGHVTIQLTRLGNESFELMVLRSYAQTLWESLIEMGREFGIDCQLAAA